MPAAACSVIIPASSTSPWASGRVWVSPEPANLYSSSALDAGSRRVVVGPREALRTRIVKLASVNWLINADEGSISCAVKVRSTRPPVPAVVTPLPESCAEVELLEGEDAVAPGQACVFYEEGGTRVLGGGWIVSAAPVRAAANISRDLLGLTGRDDPRSGITSPHFEQVAA